MKNLYLSKSRYCKCVQCPKILWLKKYKPEVAVPSEKDAIFENETDFKQAINYYIAGMTDNYAIDIYNKILRF